MYYYISETCSQISRGGCMQHNSQIKSRQKPPYDNKEVSMTIATLIFVQ